MIYVKENMSSSTPPESTNEWLFEDEIDVALSKDPGLISRKRDPQL